MTPTYDLVLISYPEGQWSIEPIGIQGVHPGQHVVTSDDLNSLLVDDARTLISTILGVDLYAFDLRFLAPTGELIATSTITSDAPGRHHKGVTHENVQLHGVLAEQMAGVDA